MGRLMGYGEDFLTLWAVTERLEQVLVQLGDDTDLTDCLIFYRPSFGRKGLYGEPDAIIRTLKTAYLVESKWDNFASKNAISKSELTLLGKQVLRHEILNWYHEKWKGEDWDKFAKKHNSEFRDRFPGKYIPLSKNLLGQNLQTILTSIRGMELKNVLLYFHRGMWPKIVTDFKVVLIEYRPTHGNFLEMRTVYLDSGG